MDNLRRSSRHALVVGGFLLAAVAMSACSAPSTPGAGAGSGAGTDGSGASGALPLDAYLSSLTGTSGSPDQVAEQKYRADLKRENEVAACMKTEGFTYTPDASKASTTDTPFGPVDDKLDSKDWVDQYGYGDVYTPQGAVGQIQRDEAAQTADDGSGGGKAMSAAERKNSDYVAQLSPGEKKAYFAALLGEGMNDPDLTVAKDWQRLGCNGKAVHDVPNEDSVMSSAQGQAIQDKIAVFYNDSATWPGVAAAEASWARCMTKAGHPGYQKQSEPSEQFAAQNADLWQGAQAGSQPPKSALDALAAKERTVALADLSCRTSTHFRQALRKVEVAQEKQFMADNKAELDALRGAAQSGSK